MQASQKRKMYERQLLAVQFIEFHKSKSRGEMFLTPANLYAKLLSMFWLSYTCGGIFSFQYDRGRLENSPGPRHQIH